MAKATWPVRNPPEATAWLQLGTLRRKCPTLGDVAFVAPPREKDRCARTRASTNRHDMDEATPRQKRETARLIARTAEPVSFDEARRLIRDLRREQVAFPILIDKIIEAERAGDHERLGRLLADAKHRMKHGDWLPLLRQVGIHTRRAQRLMARSKETSAAAEWHRANGPRGS